MPPPSAIRVTYRTSAVPLLMNDYDALIAVLVRPSAADKARHRNLPFIDAIPASHWTDDVTCFLATAVITGDMGLFTFTIVCAQPTEHGPPCSSVTT